MLKLLGALDTNTLLVALKFGYRDPNLDINEPLVKAILESRLLTTISKETKELGRINEESKTEIKLLVRSSLVIETLTKRLVWLTVVLGLLTLILVLDVANKVRQEYFSEPPLIDRTTPIATLRPQ